MDDLKAVERFRAKIAKREAGVQQDKRHHERSACKFNLDHARSCATIPDVPLSDAMAVSARIAALEEQLAGRDAEIAAWLRGMPDWRRETSSTDEIADGIEAGAYRKDGE